MAVKKGLFVNRSRGSNYVSYRISCIQLIDSNDAHHNRLADPFYTLNIGAGVPLKLPDLKLSLLSLQTTAVL